MARPAPCWRRDLLTALTVAGTAGGVLLGLALRHSADRPWGARAVMYVGFPGDVFLQMLKSLILPLIVSSIAAAVGSLDLRLSGRIGARAVAYYCATTVSAILLGVALCAAVRPGAGGPPDKAAAGGARNVTTVDTLLDLVRNMFPPNLVQACISLYQTELSPPKTLPGQDPPANSTLHDWDIGGVHVPGTNTLGLVVFAVVMGVAIARMGAEAAPLLAFFRSLSAAMMVITGWVIWISPFGVMFLIAAKVISMESLSVLAGQLGWYFMTVLVGLLVHGFVVLPLFYTIVTKKLPFRFLLNMAEAITTAFGTASSNATLPVSMRCLEERNGVDPRVSKFVMPIGATINMDGTALYEAVAALFIAQARGRQLSAGQYLAVSVTATMASIGAAGIPQAGLVTMVMVLDTVGLPAEDVTLIIAVDWLLDRFRTTINVVGDALGAGIVASLSGKELGVADPEGSAEADGKAAVVVGDD
ncbi:excitatory amino acid transporter 3-like [Bacillus rossius redtenbacheri]|uniref:excitatory amino acid transporter 3-like n=1 Tax=Bacillus rossius redtenbacheri TaxID=93214 RepID=UPI002FDEE1F1